MSAHPFPTVALYVCTTSSQHAEKLLARCRAEARLHRWRVVGELADTGGMGAAFGERPQWAHVRELVGSGQARGLVTRWTSLLAPSKADQEREMTWLSGHGVFVHYIAQSGVSALWNVHGRNAQ